MAGNMLAGMVCDSTGVLFKAPMPALGVRRRRGEDAKTTVTRPDIVSEDERGAIGRLLIRCALASFLGGGRVGGDERQRPDGA
jgi:hypothetical protein